ncbi:ATP-dependent helicase [Microbacteriaceae bacterium]|nr:ATP-dependent helicase [Candidatus Saccharibacteria bacterium]
MSLFNDRYKSLNAHQREAVDLINGPLLVVAGPGTGKTELLSMRVANILKSTDTLPGNILCLTFTETGATAMRERLAGIIGPDAYKVAIHTFHSFGMETMNHYAEYFYHGASFKPADELTSHSLLTDIFDELDLSNLLSSKLNDTYSYMRDTMTTISELKKAGLTSDELLSVITANEVCLDELEPRLSKLFSAPMSLGMLEVLGAIAENASLIDPSPMPLGITPLQHSLALSLAGAVETALDTKKTNSLTSWRNEWMEKNNKGQYIFKDRKRHEKLRAVSSIYFSYLSRMEQAGLYDFDDMILNVVHAIETHNDLRYNLQEKYQYIMVDEFQDTNLAQLRILFNLAQSSNGDIDANIMAVGDDDQAIYSFQGADVSNITSFLRHFSASRLIPLVDNYRSAKAVITHAREVIKQGADRLEHTMSDLDKTLVPHVNPTTSSVNIYELATITDERAWLADDIRKKIDSGVKPDSITVIARRHHELIGLLPYLTNNHVAVNYERRENALDSEVVRAIELIATIVIGLNAGKHSVVDGHLPELLSHPAFKINPTAIWQISLVSYKEKKTWSESLQASDELKSLFDWLIELSGFVAHEPLELLIDRIIGSAHNELASESYVSPLYAYYFGDNAQTTHPSGYISAIEDLRTIRSKLREYHPNTKLTIIDFIDFVTKYRALGTPITSIRQPQQHQNVAINLMTAHKSKGLEFEHVYILNGVDNAWGEKVRSRSRLISYPENLIIAPAGDTYDERLRLFFVAMTRAKSHLTITHSRAEENAKPTLIAGFLIGTTIPVSRVASNFDSEISNGNVLTSWHDTVINVDTAEMREILASQLESYKLPATHLNNFIDITRGGPMTFLLHNLLRFPTAKSASAGYGTAIHATLQKAHAHTNITTHPRPLEDILKDFETALKSEQLEETDFVRYEKKGIDSLTAFFSLHANDFRVGQKTELNFSNQGAIVGDARLTGSLDLVDIKDGSITVTDYKTGKPSQSWQGKTDADKVKLHKYKQQLMFYQLLVENSRDYSRYAYEKGTLQFVEPDKDGDIHALDVDYTRDELETFKLLVASVWKCITTLDLPDTSEFSQNYKGVLAFEVYLIDKYQNGY